MLISRGLLLSRAFQLVSKKNPILSSGLQSTRASHAWSYRTGAPPASKTTVIVTQLVGGYMWWWILWHLWHEHEHITGEFPYPDPAAWTNEELGIPSDN